jgi:hypothetical protein
LLEAASGDIADYRQKALNQKVLNAGKDKAPSRDDCHRSKRIAGDGGG